MISRYLSPTMSGKSCLDLLFKAHEMGELEERLRVLEDGPAVVEL